MKYIDIAFFPGCTMPGVAMGYEASSRLVFKKLGINFIDFEDFSCCAPMFVENISPNAHLAISARNLAIAEEKNLDIITFCSGCYSTLKKASYEIFNKNQNFEKANAILKKLNKKFENKIKIYHGLEFIKNKIGYSEIKKNIKFHFKGLNLASFHGCHISRPSEIVQFEDPEYPTSLDELISLLKGNIINYEGKFDCCGGTIKNLQDNISLEILRIKLKSLKQLKADAVILACPFCFYQFDAGQKVIFTQFKEKYEIPILTFTDLLGLAFGLPRKNLGLQTHRVKLKKFLQKFDEINGIENLND
ncbi:MAG: hypothetical protein EAX96_07225 [Candidatus Lokiarchaeota archaeon]|nr:hypothetical protein [Candidatus Lokiarchaeota archaeon]